MPTSPRIVQVPAQRVASIHLTVTRDGIQQAMDPAIHELFSSVARQGVAITGPWFTHHRRRPTETFDFEVCLPVAAAVRPEGRVRPGERRAARVARTLYEGSYEGLGAAWGAFQRWLDEQGHAAAEDLWEVYLVGPEVGNDAGKYRTELNRPLVARHPGM